MRLDPPPPGAWADAPPALLLPALALLLLAFARLARTRPRLQPLRNPLAALALVLGLLALLGARRVAALPGAWLLLLLPPLLVLAVRTCRLVLEALFERGRGEAPPALLGSLISVLLYGVGVIWVAHVYFGIELTPFLATSAVLGAVVGLALQDTLGNLFAGIALHTEGPFRAGDWVRLGEVEGRVEQVSWRAVRLLTWYGDAVTMPNNEVARRTLLNFSRPEAPHSRVLHLGVSYATPPARVLAAFQELLEQVPGRPAEPAPLVRISGYRESAVEYEVRYFVRAYEDYRRVEGEIYRLAWYHFRRLGIEVPFPVRTVHLERAERRAPPESRHQRLERALRSIDLFRPLSDAELALALQNFRHLHYALGERIIEEGSPGDSFFVIDSGQVEVSKRLGGAERSLARLGEGQFFGEMALLTGEARSASVTARSDVDLYCLDKAGFQQILVANPRVTEDISAILAERRDALSQALDQADARPPDAVAGDSRQRMLDRIRRYFGL